MLNIGLKITSCFGASRMGAEVDRLKCHLLDFQEGGESWCDLLMAVFHYF